MANPIPPLLCSTPPPIDFDEISSPCPNNDEDFCEFDAGETEFGQYDGQSLPSTPGHIINSKVITKSDTQLPVPIENLNICDSLENVNKSEALENFKTENDNCETNVQSEYSETQNEDVLDVEGIVKFEETDSRIIIDTALSSDLSESNSELEKSDPQSLELVTSTLSLSEINKICDEKETKSNDSLSIESSQLDQIFPQYEDKAEEILNVEYEWSERIEDEFQSQNSDNELKTIEQYQIELNEPSSLAFEAFRSSENDDVTEKYLDSFVELSATSKKFNDDNFECFAIPASNEKKESDSLVIDQKNENMVMCDNEVKDLNVTDKNTDCSFAFEADFSQFEVFGSVEGDKAVDKTNLLSNNELDNKEPSTPAFDLKVNETCDVDFDDDDFDNFQDFTSQNVQNDFDDDEDDEFSDFKEAAPPPVPLQSVTVQPTVNLYEKLKGVLELMYPICDSKSNLELQKNDKDRKLTSTLKHIDSATALNYQWATSNTKHSLVKSLGIDSRNILYGEKWNSSMPRFAANLGFNPLEPLKPVKLGTSVLGSEPTTSIYNHKTGTVRTEVPAVEFDWNTSGLINPLDGVKEILHDRKAETIDTSQSIELNDTTEQQSAITINNTNSAIITDTVKSIFQIHEGKNSVNDTTKGSIKNTEINLNPLEILHPNSLHKELQSENLDQLTHTNYQTSENIEILSPTSGGSSFVVPLKETHIFTPNKNDRNTSKVCENSNSVGNTKCTAIDFDYESAAVGIVIDETVIKKEYRDVEYNPNKFSTPSDLMSGAGIIDYKISESHYENNENNDSSGWTFHMNSLGGGNESNLKPFDNNPIVNNTNTISKTLATNFCTQELTIDTDNELNNININLCVGKIESFSKPKIGVSPTEISNEEQCKFENKQTKQVLKDTLFDDEFTEFQSVLPPSLPPQQSIHQPNNAKLTQNKLKDESKTSRTNTPTSDQMILCPAILLPQAIQLSSAAPKIEWPEPGINAEELARIETLFPQRKPTQNISNNTVTKQSQSNIDNVFVSTVNNDDDWSEFVSVPAIGLNNTVKSLNTIYCPKSPSKVSKSIISDDATEDEWSDFVSGTPNVPQSSQFQIAASTSKGVSLLNNHGNSGIIIPLNVKNIVPMSKTQSQNITNQQQVLTNNNHKISQYLLNNGSVHPKNVMQLNSLKTNDFIPQHHLYHQQQQIKLNNTNQNSMHTNQSKDKSTTNISLIPDLQFSAPQNFIHVPKKKFPKK